MVNYRSYKADIDKFRQMLDHVTDRHIEFWENYITNEPKVLELFKKNKIVAKSDDKVRSKWSVLKAKYNYHLLEDHLLYAAYIKIIRNTESVCDELIRYHEKTKSKVIKSLLSLEDITDLTVNHEFNVAISITLSKKSLGTVTHCYGKLSENFGYRPEELIGKNVNHIVPSYIRSYHDSFLREHVESGRIKLLYKNRLLYGMHKEGHIVPIKAYISPSTQLD
jgi:PAS domain S-box-containing protein